MKKSESKTESAKQGKGCLALFFGIFLLAGLGFFIPFFLWPVIQILGAGDWTETPCHIISSQVESHSGSDSTTYSIDIKYRYRFQGNQYTSDRYSFAGGSSSGHSGKQEVVRHYPPGSENVCYVNPDDPADAVLEPGFVPDLLYGLIPLVFVVVGGGGIYFALRKKPEGSDSKTRNAGSVSVSGATPQIPLEMPAGAVTLKPGTTRWGKVIGLFIFALIWNGMVFGFLVREVVQSYQKGDPEYFLTLFAVPFVLVGIGVLLGFFHSLLAVFNPKPSLTVNPSPVHLGDSFSLKWQLLGNVHRLSTMQIVIEAEEHATYRRGTNSYTDTEVFFTETVIDATSHTQMRSGSTDITIPFESMHSFESDNNKIIWAIKLKGDIKWWPDIDESFPIIIKPVTPRGGRQLMSISITFDSDKTAYFPTETLDGNVTWNLPEKEEKIEIKLFWYTRGKGSEDVVLVDARMLENPAPAGEHAFSFDLPLSPYSFSGRLISLIWAVEIVTENECERKEFVLSHLGKEVVLT